MLSLFMFFPTFVLCSATWLASLCNLKLQDQILRTDSLRLHVQPKLGYYLL